MAGSHFQLIKGKKTTSQHRREEEHEERKADLLLQPNPSGCCRHAAPYLYLPLQFDLEEQRQETDTFINVSIIQETRV